MNRIGLYAGSFDPVTNGHLDIIKRASKLVDKLIILVAINTDKAGMFDIEERRKLLRRETIDIPNVYVDIHAGLTVNYARENNVRVMFRGLRPVGDFEGEYQLQQLNQMLDPRIETAFLMCDPELQVVSSGAVKKIAALGGDISRMVPPSIAVLVQDKLRA